MSLPERVLRVGDLSVLIARQLMEGDTFKDLWIEGEVSEMTASAAGHTYFTLRDNVAQIRCTLFRWRHAGSASSPARAARPGTMCRPSSPDAIRGSRSSSLQRRCRDRARSSR